MIGVSKKSKYIYSNKIASKRNIQSLSVDNLMGVDYSSSMLNIQDNHAYDIKNFLKKNGTLQKRPPIKQTELESLNGYWECRYKGHIVKIAHIKDKLVQIHSTQSVITDALVYDEIETPQTLSDKKSWGVFTNDRLYILCGSYIVVKFNIKNDLPILTCHNVYDDVDTYIPTTTIGITGYSGENLFNINRTSLDSPNMLSSFRWNTINLDTGYYNEGDKGNYYDFELDSFVDYNKRKEVKAYLKLRNTDNELVDIELNWETEENINQSQVHVTYKSNDQNVSMWINFFGQYDFDGTFLSNKSEVTLNYNTNYLPPNLPYQDTMQIMFPVKNYDFNSIMKCTFGIMYGAGGNRNRLFISGNPEKPNVDYHTSRRNIYATDGDVDLLDSQDLTYFSVYDYCAYGTSNTAITDYQIMGDGSLMVLKEESPNEPNIYFRDSNYETKTITLGDAETQVVEETYPMRVGNIGEGAIKGFKDTLHNLNNDLVFVSDNGVFGISSTVSAGQLNSDYKYSYGRSRLINSKLKEDLLSAKNIATIVYDHKYFLTIKKKDDTYITYVADGRYPYKLKDSVDNEYEYEWFVLDGIEADKYFIIEDMLCFSNLNNTFAMDLHLKETKYQDKKIKYIKEGEIEYINGAFVKSNDLDLNKVINSNNHHLLRFHNNILVDLGEYDIDSNKIIDVSNNQQAKAHFIANSSAKSEEFIVYFSEKEQTLIQTNNNSFKLVEDEEDKIYLQINTNQTKIHFYKDLNFGDAVKTRFEFDSNGQIKNLIDEFEFPCSLVDPANLSSKTFRLKIGGIVYYNNITCHYLTKSYNFGQSVYAKYLKSMTMINDSEQLSYTNFGIITKEVKKRFEDNSFSGTNGLVDTYENIFKADLTTGRFSTSFTKDYLLKFNFIQFEFYNNDDTNCIINNFTILYTTGFKTKGVS